MVISTVVLIANYLGQLSVKQFLKSVYTYRRLLPQSNVLFLRHGAFTGIGPYMLFTVIRNA